MTSTIPLHSSAIDVNYPVAGINQSSQGFRSNFASIKNGLDQAATEISLLQGKIVVVTGDVSGTSAAVGSTNSPISIALVLPNIVSTPGSFDWTSDNVSATVNAKGQVTALTVTPFTNNIVAGQTYKASTTAAGNNLGSGTGTIALPKFKFDAAGKVTDIDMEIMAFGLVGHSAARGAVVAGDTGSKTVITPVPATFDSTRVLMATGNGASGLEWVPLVIPGGTVVAVLEGPGINVTPSSATPTISMDISTLTDDATIEDVDSLAYFSVVDADTRRITYADLKADISTDFLPTDLGAIPLMSTHANGVVITSANGITLNSLKWPTAAGTVGQVLTLSTGGQIIWSGSSNATVTKTFYVSDEFGSDTTGTGGFTTPYKTIAKGLSMAVDTGTVWTVALLAGTYTENVTITAQNVIIKGVGGVSKPILKGVVTIDSGTNFIGFENLKLDRSDQTTGDTQPALFGGDDLTTLQVLDCDFLRGSGAKSELPIVQLTGNLTKGALFDGCAFQGQVEINLVGASDDIRTVISNVRQLGDREWTAKLGGDVTLNNIPVIKGIQHTAGDVILENIGSVKSRLLSVTYNDTPVYSWTGGVPDYVSGQGPGYLATPVLLLDEDGKPVQAVDGTPLPLWQADGVTPIWETTTGVQVVTLTPVTGDLDVGVYSTATTGSLQMYDVNMFNGVEYARIIKTGAAGWSFANVQRRASADILEGARIVQDIQVDTGDFMVRYESDSAGLRYADTDGAVLGGKLDPNQVKIAHVTLTGANSHLTLATPSATSFDDGLVPESSEFATEFKVFVQQDSTGGRTVIWSADSKPEIMWYGDYVVDDAPNAISIFTFYYHTSTQQWVGVRTSKGADRMPVFNETATVVPALRHANSHVVITHATGASFQINPALARFPIGTTFTVEQGGAGAITFSAVGGVNIHSKGALTSTSGQYAVARLVKKTATDWTLSGDLA